MISGWARLGLLWTALAALPGLTLPGCYDLPRPECGFRCGPDGACPEDYTCSQADGRCHLNGSSPSLVCAADGGLDGAAAAAAAAE